MQMCYVLVQQNGEVHVCPRRDVAHLSSLASSECQSFIGLGQGPYKALPYEGHECSDLQHEMQCRLVHVHKDIFPKDCLC